MMSTRRATAMPVAAMPAAMRQPMSTLSWNGRRRVRMKVTGSREMMKSDAIVKPKGVKRGLATGQVRSRE
jgi:hypothetical protein